MWRKGRFCDVVVVVDGQRFDVHRVVLAIASPFFTRAFEGSFSESKHCAINIELPGGAAAWEPIAEFMYTGMCRMDVHSLLPLLEAAHYVQITCLVSQLAQAIAARITPATFGDAWEVAGRLTLPAFEKHLATFAANTVEDIAAFACSPGFASLPEPVLSRIRESTAKRTKTLHLVVVRDGTSKHEKLSKVRKYLGLLGSGMEAVSMTIDKQARVDVSWVAPPETCAGGSHFHLNFSQLFKSFGPGARHELNTCEYAPKEDMDRFFSLRTRNKYTFISETFSVDTVSVADGYPKTVRASPHGPPLSHYKLHLDVGLSYAKACEKLAKARQKRSDKAADGGTETAVMSGEGVYRTDAPKPGYCTNSYSLLVWSGKTDRNQEPVYRVYTPEGLPREGATTEAKHLEQNTKIFSAEVAEAGWTAAYEAALTQCVHGPKCGCHTIGKNSEEDGYRPPGAKALAEAALKDALTYFRASSHPDECVVAPLDEPEDGSFCMRGRRLRVIHLIVGDGLVPLWGQLAPKAILRVELSASSPAAADGEPPANRCLTGMWVDVTKVPKY